MTIKRLVNVNNYVLLVAAILFLMDTLHPAHGNSYNNGVPELNELKGVDYNELPHLTSPDGIHALVQIKSKTKKECMGGDQDGEPLCPWDSLILYDAEQNTPLELLEVSSYISGVQWFPDNNNILYTKREDQNNYQTTIIKNIDTDESKIIGHSGAVYVLKDCEVSEETQEGLILIQKDGYYRFGGHYSWWEIIDAEGNTQGVVKDKEYTEQYCTFMDLLERPQYQ